MRLLPNLFLPFLLFGTLMFVGCTSVEPTKDSSQDATYHKLMGASALNENNPADALREYLQAEQFDDRDPEIQAGLAEAYMRKKAFVEAERHYQRALDLSNYEPKYFNNLGALYLTMERYDDAIAAFRSAAENLLFDRPEVSWTGVGVANYQKGDYPAAERAYQKAKEINPLYFQVPYRLGELYFAQGRPVEAAENFNKAVELFPNFAEGYYWLGLTYMKIEETGKARSAFQDVVRLDPRSEEARLAKKYLDILD
ncbi:MAG: tetratricopeptide repeat protein [Deltaproteobacteria bacterium]|jgi:Tfp pilus assembly protein PilF|nr:tetratricopeptide repeat protein [Deltaproteobacteria bacterium]